MFDFFKDMLYELNGIDSKAAKEERKNKLEERKKNRIIFPQSGKTIIFIFGILYLIIGCINIVAMSESGTQNALLIVRFILLLCCDVSCLVCLAIGNKKTEIAALLLILVFVLAQCFTPLFL